MGFALMNDQKFEINITPAEAEPTWVVLAKGIMTAEPSTNEEIDQTVYFDSSGFKESDVTGMQLVQSFTGHRYYGDEAQDYIFSKMLELGAARRTTFRYTEPDGGVYTGSITIANIQPPSGDAGAKGEIAFEIHYNGKPEYTVPPVVQGA